MLEGSELDRGPAGAAGSRRWGLGRGVAARMRVCAHVCGRAGLCVCGAGRCGR